MSRILRVIAALLILASGVVLFAVEGSKLFAVLLIAGNLFALAAHFHEART